MSPEDKLILKSKYVSRDLSWVNFNNRVLAQAKRSSRTIIEKLKFVAITASNLDEFMMIRVGSLYNYLDFDKPRVDYCGLREKPFKNKLFGYIHDFVKDQSSYFEQELRPQFKKNGFDIVGYNALDDKIKRKADYYFSKTIYPMLSPMVYDTFHTFPLLRNKTLTFSVLTKGKEKKAEEKMSFVQLPQNLPRFYQVEVNNTTVFIPIEDIVENNIQKLYKGVKIVSISLFRLTRNGDFNYDDYDESETGFVDEIQKKLKKRQTGRVVRLEHTPGMDERVMQRLEKQLDFDLDNCFEVNSLLDYTSMWQIVKCKSLAHLSPDQPVPIKPMFAEKDFQDDLFSYLKENDLILHHPYNNMETVVELLEQAAVDPKVLAIKITIYRLAGDSRISDALLKAAENGKHVSVLFEVKARFDEENNIQEGRRLQKAGCYVIYGFEKVKTHTKLLMILRQEDDNNMMRYVHMSSGNYNEDTAKLYTDIGYLTTKRVYGNDVAEFFNAITGHAVPDNYKRLITTPGDMRKKLISLIRKEVRNKKAGKQAGIVIKVNSLEDRSLIDELYKASKQGVNVHLIIRGICCIRPGRPGLSENIYVKSIVGDYLEHTRIYYFHNEGDPKVYGGSADIMVRSFDRRIESLFLVEGQCREVLVHILDYNLRDQVNSFAMNEDGSYSVALEDGKKGFDMHDAFFKTNDDTTENIQLPVSF